MGLVESLSAQPSSKLNNPCSVYVLRKTLNEEENRALTDAIVKIVEASPRDRSAGRSPYTANWLRRVLAENGHRINRSSLNAHISGDCSCESV